ncbi:MAG: mechanosensitive ion channel family protein [Cyanobacteria bacterium J06621_8]
MLINIVTVIAEVSLVFICCFLANWVFKRIYRQIWLKIPFFKNQESTALQIRRRFSRYIWLVGVLLSLIIIGVNGYLIYQGENVRDYSLQLIKRIPQQFWQALGFGIIKSIGAIVATIVVLKVINYLLGLASKFAQNFDNIIQNDESVASFFESFKKIINNISWIAIAILCAQFLFLPSIVTNYLFILLRIYLIITSGLLVFKIVAVIVDSLDALSVKYSREDNLLRLYAQLRYLIPLIKRCIEYIIYMGMATLVLQQIDFIAQLAQWGPVGIKLIAIFLASRILISIVVVVIDEFLVKAKNREETEQQRYQTTTPLIKSTAKYLIYFGASIFVLDTVGINPAPILAGAGIIGLAVGLGAQNLINDVVSGFFILFENYYLVGDYIETDEASGYVEAIELRTTKIRHNNGQVYIVRNGDITSVTNYSKEFVYAAIDVGVDYDTDLDHAYQIIETIGHQLNAQNEDVLESTQVEGVEEFGEIRLSIHTKTRVKPGKHLQVQRTLRKLIKDAFDREGIYIPIGETTDKPGWVTQTQQK